jgi:hypothetical protein
MQGQDVTYVKKREPSTSLGSLIFDVFPVK